MATTPKVQEIGLDELVTRVRQAAGKMGKANPNRLLLFNTAAALTSLGERLEDTLDEVGTLKRELEATRDSQRSIVLPGGGLHRVN